MSEHRSHPSDESTSGVDERAARYAAEGQLFDELAGASRQIRALRLAEVADNDPALHRRVAALLAADAALGEHEGAANPAASNAGASSEPPAGDRAAAVAGRLDDELRPGSRVGRYTLGSLLGEGGFGSVWRAEQQAPVRRLVALKVLRRGMDSEAILLRFRAEMQALASMDSPHIAKILDAGTTPQGRPFFAMELVEGLPITRFCDLEALAIPARIALLIQVCEAVQHAHQKGVFHRDIKPQNVLATLRDGRPFATVIDFGIAKAAEGTSGAATVEGQRLGTPTFMSLEQMRGDTDIDARTDVFSLGVLLCEVVAGATPATLAGVSGTSWAELERFVAAGPFREIANSLARMGSPAPEELARHRGTTIGGLHAALRGELEWIIARATEPDRARRYATVGELASDLQRHLDGEPLFAGPPDTLYRVSKFVRRHRGAVGAAAAILAAMVLGLVGTTLGLVRASRALEASQARERETEAVAAFQGRMIVGVDPQRLGAAILEPVLSGLERGSRESEAAEGSPDVPTVNATDLASVLVAKAILEPAVAALAEERHLSPASRAHLLSNVADGYDGLGDHGAAAAQRHKALALMRNLHGPDDPRTLRLAVALGQTLLRAGEVEEASLALEDAEFRLRRGLGPRDPDRLVALARHGEALLSLGRLAEATTSIAEARTLLHEALGPEDVRSIEASELAAAAALARGEIDEAEALHAEVMAIADERWGGEHQQSARLVGAILVRLLRQGRIAEAEPYARRSLELSRRRLGDDHPETLVAIKRLGAILGMTGDLEESEQLCRLAASRSLERYGAGHVQSIETLSNLARTVQLRGRIAEALELHREALSLALQRWGEDDARSASLRSNVGVALLLLGRLEEADEELALALAQRVRTLPPKHPDLVQSHFILGAVRHQKGRPHAAVELLREVVDVRAETLGPDHPETWLATEQLAAALADCAQLGEAEALLRSVQRAKHEASLDEATAIDRSSTDALLASVRRRQGDLVEAERLASSALAQRVERLGSANPGTLEVEGTLAAIEIDLGRAEDAERRLVRALAEADAALGPDYPVAVTLAADLAAIWLNAGRAEDSRTMLGARVAAVEEALPSQHPLRARLTTLLAQAERAVERELPAGEPATE